MHAIFRSTLIAFLVAGIGGQYALCQGFKFLEVKVVDPDGKPMADVPVEININNMKFPMPTDEKGIVAVNVPAGEEGELELSVQQPGYMAQGARWAKGNKIPEKFTFPMKKGSLIGGIVHDEQGKPIAGVKVEGIITGLRDDDINGGKGELLPSLDGEIGVTDDEGRWQCDAAPDRDSGLQLRFSHSDYVSDGGYSFRGGTWEELLGREKIVLLQKGIILTGTVVDSKQQPIVGAKIGTGREIYLSGRVVVSTDEKGNYQINNAKTGPMILTVSAPGFAPDLRTVSVSKEMSQADFQLGRGNSIRVRVIDKAGGPVAGVKFNVEEWRGVRSLDRIERLTDEQGFWEWADAPADEVKYHIWKSGHMSLETKLTAGKKEQTVTLLPAVVVNGKVYDKGTNLPIELFKYVEGVWWEPGYDSYVLQSMNVEAGKNGKFRFQMQSVCEKFCLRVEAEGYRPLISREIFPDEGEISLDFELIAGSGPKGVVLMPNGKPAVGAEVALATSQQRVSVSNGRIQRNSGLSYATTDAEGRYSLPLPDGKSVMVAVHASGWAETPTAEDDEPQQVVLAPWARLEGRSLRGVNAVGGESIAINIQSSNSPDEPRVGWHYRTDTDSKGNFEFARLKSGAVTVQRVIRYFNTERGYGMTAYSHGVTVESADKESHIQIGGAGRHVKGQLAADEKDRSSIDWNAGAVNLTAQGANQKTPTTYATAIEPDGSFEIFDVAPGRYQLQVGVYSATAPIDNNWNEIAVLKQGCEVPDEKGVDPVDLGTFTVPLIKSQD